MVGGLAGRLLTRRAPPPEMVANEDRNRALIALEALRATIELKSRALVQSEIQDLEERARAQLDHARAVLLLAQELPDYEGLRLQLQRLEVALEPAVRRTSAARDLQQMSGDAAARLAERMSAALTDWTSASPFKLLKDTFATVRTNPDWAKLDCAAADTGMADEQPFLAAGEFLLASYDGRESTLRALRTGIAQRLSTASVSRAPGNFCVLAILGSIVGADALAPLLAVFQNPTLEGRLNRAQRRAALLALTHYARPDALSSSNAAASACHWLAARDDAHGADLPLVVPGAIRFPMVDAGGLLRRFAGALYAAESVLADPLAMRGPLRNLALALHHDQFKLLCDHIDGLMLSDDGRSLVNALSDPRIGAVEILYADSTDTTSAGFDVRAGTALRNACRIEVPDKYSLVTTARSRDLLRDIVDARSPGAIGAAERKRWIDPDDNYIGAILGALPTNRLSARWAAARAGG